ncbi:MAG: SDR family oxidoreductase [Candidatus Peribacteraceae bacterium]|jgi:NAD(P)-dependent dehydrogenase (short-subunit alcohol dehydrogenase family)
MKIEGKTVVITGGSNGIGLALGRVLIAQNNRVFSFDIRKPETEEPGLLHIPVDVTDSRQITAGLQALSSPIDILVNNAGIMRRGTMLDSSEEDFDLLCSVNVKGSWLMIKHAVPRLRKGATIVQMASRYALNPRTDPGLYGLMKQAQWNLAQLAAKTLPQFRFVYLFPGPVDTALARYEVPEKALKEKEHIMHSPEELTQWIVTLLENSKKSKLVYNEKKRTYSVE